MKEKVINYGKVETVIRDFESLAAKHNLDLDEQKFIFAILEDRRIQKITKMRTDDALGNIPFGFLLGKAKKEIQKEEE